MNRIVLIITLFFFLSLLFVKQAHAQRYLPGLKGIQLTGGFVDGFTLEKKDGQAFYGSIGLSTYTNSGDRWTFGAEYMQKSHEYKTSLFLYRR